LEKVIRLVEEVHYLFEASILNKEFHEMKENVAGYHH
jgi:hypothetical protein